MIGQCCFFVTPSTNPSARMCLAENFLSQISRIVSFVPQTNGLRRNIAMIRPALDLPCLYTTEVSKRPLAVFQRDCIKKLVCAALNDARASGCFSLLAYVVMPDHLHLLTD